MLSIPYDKHAHHEQQQHERHCGIKERTPLGSFSTRVASEGRVDGVDP